MEIRLNELLVCDVLEGLSKLADKSVHCIVTSPPYFWARDYKITPTKWPAVTYHISFGTMPLPITIPEMECQLGLEPSPEAYIGHLVMIFRECKRVLRDDGTLWLNLGDSYNSKSGGYKNSKSHLGYHFLYQ